MKEIKSINILSVAKVSSAIMGILALILIGSLELLKVVAGSYVPADLAVPAPTFLSILIAIVFYTVFGFIAGALLAFLYNTVSRWFGGIKIKV